VDKRLIDLDFDSDLKRYRALEKNPDREPVGAQSHQQRGVLNSGQPVKSSKTVLESAVCYANLVLVVTQSSYKCTSEPINRYK
jgi:hypothetical protein